MDSDCLYDQDWVALDGSPSPKHLKSASKSNMDWIPVELEFHDDDARSTTIGTNATVTPVEELHHETSCSTNDGLLDKNSSSSLMIQKHQPVVGEDPAAALLRRGSKKQLLVEGKHQPVVGQEDPAAALLRRGSKKTQPVVGEDPAAALLRRGSKKFFWPLKLSPYRSPVVGDDPAAALVRRGSKKTRRGPKTAAQGGSQQKKMQRGPEGEKAARQHDQQVEHDHDPTVPMAMPRLPSSSSAGTSNPDFFFIGDTQFFEIVEEDEQAGEKYFSSGGEEEEHEVVLLHENGKLLKPHNPAANNGNSPGGNNNKSSKSRWYNNNNRSNRPNSNRKPRRQLIWVPKITQVPESPTGAKNGNEFSKTAVSCSSPASKSSNGTAVSEVSTAATSKESARLGSSSWNLQRTNSQEKKKKIVWLPKAQVEQIRSGAAKVGLLKSPKGTKAAVKVVLSEAAAHAKNQKRGGKKN
ncbi:unnamed protein product [Amoebophrya sp. A120]|nr:unnamed protein product [Amoebophrya sp. A120]|eukprot:GSA120T00016914001.1